MPPAKIRAEQEQEARHREKERDPDALTDAERSSPEPDTDTAAELAPSKPIEREAKPEQPERKPLPVRSPHDERRNDIVARFRKSRQDESTSEAAEDVKQIRDFTRSGMPPELLALEAAEVATPEPEPEPAPTEAAEAEPEPAPPTKRKLKVRGKELELTDEELVAAAQKSLAADDYLDEAKAKLKEVDALARQYRDMAARGSQAQHQGQEQSGAQSATQTTQSEAGEPTSETIVHPDDPFAKVVETIQYGDPKEAAPQLKSMVAEEAARMAKEELRNERLRNDSIRSGKILKDFEAAHPELANDQFARAAIERRLFDLQVEDIKALGLSEDVIPKSPRDVANWHQFYRVEGHNVRDAAALLTTARDDFLQWRGGPKPASPAPGTAAPTKVTVTLDRAQRRAQIPQQPTRTVTPKSDAQTAPVQPRARSDIVKEMMANRAKGRGSVIPT